MKKLLCFGVLCIAALLSVSSMTMTAQAADVSDAAEKGGPATSAVQLRHWVNSTENERFSFLIGLVSMVEMEHEWQGDRAIPVSQSINGTWARGLSGVSIRDMDRAINNYITTHPNEMDKPVVEVLGKIYVRPKLTQTERNNAIVRLKSFESGISK